jgi:hypothetical protein
MSIANPLWGAPRIHGELLKLGIDIGQTSVAKYMVKKRGPPSQGWKTFLHNHADGIAAMDLFVVPTISFRLLYGLLIMGHGRRQILWFGVTANPTAEWIANQVMEACGWEQAPRYLIRDRDGAYWEVFIRRLRSVGIREPADIAALPMAKRICRTADRFDPTGVLRSRCCVRRATPPSRASVVHEISQRDKDAFIFGEGCAGLARRQTSRHHSLPPGPGRAAPPICSDLIYDRHRWLAMVISTAINGSNSEVPILF